ncbi:MarR family winged helix-turn-helix transcriptional regulator [Kitasatospora sp. NPDC059673]|uniref:MarR family winged helix-turn-helix transcriptional regulator n=1 Tax=Kitasatospora sp. NPDC059673 TaxID=3346901 RepID=UPI003684DB51
MHGFALQAIGLEGATASEVGRRLGVSKQAAGKTVDRLEALDCAERAEDPGDARRKVVRLTPRGLDMLARRRCSNRADLRAVGGSSASSAAGARCGLREHLQCSSGRGGLSPVFGMIFGPIRPPRMVVVGATEGAGERGRVE